MVHDASTATIVVSDMVGSTTLRVRLGEERADVLLEDHLRLMQSRIEAHGGELIRRQGDGLVAAFRAASNAVTAAVEMQKAVASYNRRPDALGRIAIRIGMSVGDVSWDGSECRGTPMVEATRLETCAEAGQILCSEFVRMMARGRGGHEFRSAGERELRGLPEPLAVCEVLWEPDPDRAPLPFPAELAVDAGRPFVSRADELALAETIAGDRDRGRLAVIWLVGEPGIGKTRLAAEIAARVHRSGGVVVFGRCSEDLTVPFQPFLEALRWYVDRVPALELADRLGDAPGELTRLVPEIGDRIPGIRPTQSTSPDIAQHRLFEAVRSWLAAAGAGRPLVAVLDDVHWAAAPTLALLAHLARSAEPSGAILVCTARDTSPDDNPRLAAVVDELVRRRAPSHRVALPGLSPIDVEKLVEEAAGRPLDDSLRALATELHSDTAGNPLFIDALLSSPSGTTTRQGAALPRTLADTVRERIARLPDQAAALLRTASVVGLSFDLRVAAAGAGCDDVTAVEALEVAARAGLAEEMGANQYRFRHALVRKALRDRLSGSRRVRLHLRVGEALETLFTDTLDDHAAALAFHFSEAVSVGGAGRAYRYTRMAAQRASRQLSHQEAADAYRRALQLLDEVEGAASPDRFGLLLALAEAQRRAGDDPAALEALRTAAAEATVANRPEQLARAAVAFEEVIFWRGHPSDECLELVERAEAALGDEESALHALTLASLGRALDFSGRSSEGGVRGGEAAAMAERAGDPATRFAVLFRTIRPSVSVEHAEARAAGWKDLCARAVAIGDDDARLLGLVQAMWATAMLGDLDGCDEIFAEYSRAAVELRQPKWEHGLDLFPAFRAMLAGDLDVAERYLLQTDRLAAGRSWAPEGLHGVSMFLLRREQGRLAELESTLRALVRVAPAAALWSPGLAALYAELGMHTEARAEFDRLAANGFSGLASDSTRELALGLAAEVCVELGEVDRAPELIDALRPCTGRLMVIFGSPATLGPADRLLAMLSSLTGRVEDAARWHRGAIALARRLRSPLWVAHSLHDQARHLLAIDEERARALLTEAAEIGARHRLIGLLSRLERLQATG